MLAAANMVNCIGYIPQTELEALMATQIPPLMATSNSPTLKAA
jgi:hypothetical protein